MELAFYYSILTNSEKLEYLERLGERLLEHRYRYYIKCDPVIADFLYDYLERYYEAVALDLGVDPIASVMVDFDLKREDAQAAMYRVDTGTDNHSLWLSSIRKRDK